MQNITIWVTILGEFEGLGCGNVSISGCDCQDDRVWVSNVFSAHLTDLDLYVLRLVSNWHLQTHMYVHIK